jgi:hypothetical protein
MEYKHIETRTECKDVFVNMQDENGKSHVIRFTHAKNDASGNPRLIVHFLAFINFDEKDEKLTIMQEYAIAKKKARAAGFRVYRGKDYAGGFVAQGWFPDHLAENILKQRYSK